MAFVGMLMVLQRLMVLTFSAESADVVGMFPPNINYEQEIIVVDVPSTAKVSAVQGLQLNLKMRRRQRVIPEAGGDSARNLRLSWSLFGHN